MISKRKVISFTKENKWIIAASIFFIVWKFFLVSVLLGSEMARSSDAMLYIHHIDSINSCSYVVFCKEFILSFHSYFGFEHLSYRLFFGLIGHLLRLDSVHVFYLSFYIGTILALPCLIYFLKKIERNNTLVALLLFFLALYNGGPYHGFFWVVPSFFATLLILVIFGIVLDEKSRHWMIALTILVPIALYTHTISLYLMAPMVVFYFIYSFFKMQLDRMMFRKISFLIFVLVAAFTPVSLYLKGNPFGPEMLLNKPVESTNISSQETISKSHEQLFPGFTEIRKEYFDILFFRPIFILVFIAVLSILFYYKEFLILSLYFASLSITLASSISVNGLRSLILTWPFTYLLYAYGLWHAFQLNDTFIHKKLPHTLIKVSLYAGLSIFIVLNIAYSYFLDRDGLTNLQKLFGI